MTIQERRTVVTGEPTQASGVHGTRTIATREAAVRRSPGNVLVFGLAQIVTGLRIVRRLPNAVARAGEGAGRLGDRVPGLVARARRGAGDTTSALQTLPDPDLRIVAAASIGCAAGLYLAGAPRIVTLPTMAPALMAAGAILSRPDRVGHGR